MKKYIFLIKNKYVIAILLFVVWMLFFDPKDWTTISERQSKLEELQNSEKVLTDKIKNSRKELTLLKTSAETIEKYAREKYKMKKDNEDLFIIEDTDSEN
ncbi:MAG: septum formation initiator family protein [Ferruginibacter sp.]